TLPLLQQARRRDPQGDYRQGVAEKLDFADGGFDLVVSYLTLIDIADIEAAIPEMARVLAPGGSLLIANLNPFLTACLDQDWQKDAAGNRLHWPVDNYLRETPHWLTWS